MEWTQTIISIGEAFSESKSSHLRDAMQRHTGKFFQAYHIGNLQVKLDFACFLMLANWINKAFGTVVFNTLFDSIWKISGPVSRYLNLTGTWNSWHLTSCVCSCIVFTVPLFLKCIGKMLSHKNCNQLCLHYLGCSCVCSYFITLTQFWVSLSCILNQLNMNKYIRQFLILLYKRNIRESNSITNFQPLLSSQHPLIVKTELAHTLIELETGHKDFNSSLKVRSL